MVGGAAIAQSIADERADLARAQRDAGAARARSARLEAAAAAARDDAARANARSAAVAARVQAAEADIDAAEARVAIIDRQRADLAGQLAIKQAPTARLVAALTALARRPTALALVQPGTVADAVHVRAVLSAAVPVVAQRTAGLRADIERTRALRAQAALALGQLDASRRALAQQRDALARLAIERRSASDRLTGGAMIEQDRAIGLGEDARDITELMGRIEADAGARARLATLPGPVMRPARPGEARLPPQGDVAGDAHAAYRLPVVGRVVTGLGEVSDTGVRARGLTIATQPGALVVAPSNGRVAFAGSYRGYGRIVIIDHGGGWTTLITSLAALDVAVGDPVEQGAAIGRAGPDRPTITVELRRDGQPVDIGRIAG